MNKQELLEMSHEARENHLGWKAKQAQQRRLHGTIKKHVGSEEWHNRWVKYYDGIIDLLKGLTIVALFSGCMPAVLMTSASGARVAEAGMDAEQFNDPVADRSIRWHVLKVPRAAGWAVWGIAIASSEESWKGKLAWGAASLGLAFVVFELSLEQFRR